MKSFWLGLILVVGFILQSCSLKPIAPPAPIELKQLFYSLNQSNFSGFSCEVQSQLLLNLSDVELNLFFKNQFKREPTLQEKGMLKKVKWSVINTNEKQAVVPVPASKFFPTNETKDIVDKITILLTIINKVMTLTYLETFADRPDLSKVLVNEKFYQVLNTAEEVVAELEFNRKIYRIFFGIENQRLDQVKDQIQVTMANLGSMEIPEMIELKSSSGKGGKFYPQFEVIQGFPQLKKIEVLIPELGQTRSPFVFENCEYLKTSEPTN